MDGVTVMVVAIHEEGLEIQATFNDDERRHLDRAHTFYVGYEQEEFGEEAREIRTLAQDLAYEVLHGYNRQPRP